MTTNLTNESFYKETDIFYIELTKGIIYNRVTDEDICTVYTEENALFLLKLLNNIK